MSYHSLEPCKQGLWVINHSSSPYWTDIYKNAGKNYHVTNLYFNPLSVLRLSLVKFKILIVIYNKYRTFRGYPQRTEYAQPAFTVFNFIYAFVYIFLSPLYLFVSIFISLRLAILLLPHWTRKSKLNILFIKKRFSFFDVYFADCIFTQYFRCFFSNGTISSFTYITLPGLLYSSFLVYSRVASLVIARFFSGVPWPEYFIINEFGYSDELVRRLLLTHGSIEFSRQNYNEYLTPFALDHETINSIYSHPGAFVKSYILSSIEIDEHTDQSVSSIFDYSYMRKDLSTLDHTSLVNSITADYFAKVYNSIVIVHMHAVSDVQYVCGYDNFLDLDDWLTNCISTLTMTNNLVCLKLHPNVCTFNSDLSCFNYPSDVKYASLCLRKYGFSSDALSQLYRRSPIIENLLLISPYINTIEMLAELNSSNIYACSVTHHGTVALEASIANIPSYSHSIASNIGFHGCCFTYQNLLELSTFISDKPQPPSSFSNNSVKLLQHRQRSYEASCKIKGIKY